MFCAVTGVICAIAHRPSTIAREAMSPCPCAPPDKLLSMATCVVRNDVATFTKSVPVSVCRLPFHLTTILTGFAVLRLLSAIANCISVCVGRRHWCSSTRPGPICCVTLRMRVDTLTAVRMAHESSRFCLNPRSPSAGNPSAALASLTISRFAGLTTAKSSSN